MRKHAKIYSTFMSKWVFCLIGYGHDGVGVSKINGVLQVFGVCIAPPILDTPNPAMPKTILTCTTIGSCLRNFLSAKREYYQEFIPR